MGIWSSFKKGVDTVFYIRPKQWVSWDFITSNSRKNYDNIKAIFSPVKAVRKESFAQAVHRHGLTKKHISIIKDRYVFYSYLFVTFALGLVFYSLQAVIQWRALQAIGSFCLSLLVFSLAFRYHFWAFQIRKEKLGCTVKQWWDDLCGRNTEG